MLQHSNPATRESFYEIERGVRRQRTLLMQAYLRSVAGGVAALFRMLVRLARRVAAAQRLRSGIRALGQFDDRTLADIGVNRDNFEYVVRNGRPRPMPAAKAARFRRTPRLAQAASGAGARIEAGRASKIAGGSKEMNVS